MIPMRTSSTTPPLSAADQAVLARCAREAAAGGVPGANELGVQALNSAWRLDQLESALAERERRSKLGHVDLGRAEFTLVDAIRSAVSRDGLAYDVSQQYEKDR